MNLIAAPSNRSTVCLSFDFDAISVFMGTMGLSTPQYISRGEFAAEVAVPRILDVLDREDVVSTWFIPGFDAETYPDLCKRIRDGGHEIGHHGYLHETPSTLTEAQEREVMERGLSALDRAVGVRPVGYRSPAADLSEASIDILLEHGFSYDSSLWGGDYSPYRVHSSRSSTSSVSLTEMPIGTIGDLMWFEFLMLPPFVMPANVNVAALGKRWIEDLHYMDEEAPGGVISPVFHPLAIGRGSRLRLLENLIKAGKDLGYEFSTHRDASARWEREGQR